MSRIARARIVFPLIIVFVASIVAPLLSSALDYAYAQASAQPFPSPSSPGQVGALPDQTQMWLNQTRCARTIAERYANQMAGASRRDPRSADTRFGELELRMDEEVLRQCSALPSEQTQFLIDRIRCVRSVGEKYSNEISSAFRLDPRSADARFRDLEFRLYEQVLRQCVGPNPGETKAVPSLPSGGPQQPYAQQYGQGPDWWNRFRQPTTPPLPTTPNLPLSPAGEGLPCIPSNLAAIVPRISGAWQGKWWSNFHALNPHLPAIQPEEGDFSVQLGQQDDRITGTVEVRGHPKGPRGPVNLIGCIVVGDGRSVASGTWIVLSTGALPDGSQLTIWWSPSEDVIRGQYNVVVPARTPGDSGTIQAQRSSAPVTVSSTNSQLLVQVQQIRTAWQRLSTQINQVAISVEDRQSLVVDVQRMNQALDAAEAAARAGNQTASQTYLAEAQRLLSSVQQRLGRVAKQPTPLQPPTPVQQPATTAQQPTTAAPAAKFPSGSDMGSTDIASEKRAANHPPSIEGLGQFMADGETLIPEGGTTPEGTVVFGGVVHDPDGDQVRLEIELRQVTEPFTGEPTSETTSQLVASGSEVAVSRAGLVAAGYHWQARAVDVRGAASAWVELGESGNADFEVARAAAPLGIVREIDSRASILLTYKAKESNSAHVMLDLTLNNVARTWFLIRREGNLDAGDGDVPFVFLLGPDGTRSFTNVKFVKGETLRFVASKAGVFDEDQLLALGALSVDMFGRGLFGVTLPSDIFDGRTFDLLRTYVNTYRDTVLEKVSLELSARILPALVTSLVELALKLDMNDPHTREFIDELYRGLGGAADWAKRMLGNAVELFNMPAHGALVWDLHQRTNAAPLDGFASVSVR